MKINVSITGDKAVRAELLRIGSLPSLALAQTAEGIEDFIAVEAAKHNKRGRLVSSIYKRRLPGAWEIGHDPLIAPHALFVHWGTRPHDIRPKAKKAIRWPAGGKFVFAKGVHHPGYKGDPWMTRAAAQAPLIFDRHIKALMALQRST